MVAGKRRVLPLGAARGALLGYPSINQSTRRSAERLVTGQSASCRAKRRRSADSPVPALMMNHSNHICDHAPLSISFIMRPPYATRLRAQWPVSPGRRQGVQLGVRAQAAVLPAEDNELLTRRTPRPPADDASRHPRGPQPRHCLSSRWLGTQVSPAETDCPLVPGLLHSDT